VSNGNGSRSGWPTHAAVGCSVSLKSGICCLIARGILRRSTVHRVLASRRISARPVKPATTTDLDRFGADYPNDLWQSDLLQGPWLPDPSRRGNVRRAHLYAFLDDHSRMLLHGRFSFREDLPILELVFRGAIQRWGVPRRVYYDRGQVYRAHHMLQIVAAFGIHKVIYTLEYRPEGHGKMSTHTPADCPETSTCASL
jgi:putative transposase